MEYKNEILEIIEENDIQLVVDVHGTNQKFFDIGINGGENVQQNRKVAEA